MGYLFGVAGAVSGEQLRRQLTTLCKAANPAGKLSSQELEVPGFACAGLNHQRELSLAGTRVQRFGSSSLLAVSACLDNRKDLVGDLELPAAEALRLSDPELASLAWRRWGDACRDRLIGDWVCIEWDGERRRLTLLRDHNGNSILYFACKGGMMAFGTSGRALLALPWISNRLDELSLACIVANMEPVGRRTVYADLCRLPPGWMATLDGRDSRLQRYWFPEDTPLWEGQGSSAYQEALRTGIADAVGRMVVRAGDPAIQLSGGLDSGAVAWGASQVQLPSKGVAGYCSVPVHDTQAAWPAEAVTNELALAKEIGRITGVDPVRAVPATGVSVLDGIRWMLDVRLEPSIGAGNMYWISALLREAKARGHDLILTGQQGNGTISWYGRPWSRSFGELWRHRSPAGAVQHKLLRPLLSRMGRDGVNRWRIGSEPWLAGTLIRPEFARKVHLREYIAEEAYGFWFHSFAMDPRIDRWRVIEAGQSRVGGRWAEGADALGLRVRDPTATKALVELSLSIPDREWSGPAGSQRWLVRQAMQGLLPNSVTGSLSRGRQAADIVQRLLSDTPAVEDLLGRCSPNSQVAQYLDMERSRTTWQALSSQPFTYRLQQRCLQELIPAITLAMFLEQRQP